MKFLNRTINFFFCLIVIVSALGCIMKLGELLKVSAPSAALMMLIIISVVAFCYVNRIDVKSVTVKVNNLFSKYNRLMAMILILVTLVWQWNMVYALAGHSGWDPGVVTLSAMAKHSKEWFEIYFSEYPNNILLLLLDHSIWQSLENFGTPTYRNFMYVLGILNYLVYDLAMLLLTIGMHCTFGKLAAWFTGIVGLILILVSPVGVIPYSDSLTFLVISAILLHLTYLTKGGVRWKKWLNLMWLGILAAFGCLIKPTVLILFIALVILIAFKVGNKQLRLQNVAKAMIPVIISFGCTYLPLHHYELNSEVVKIDAKKKMPMNHFLAMGMSKDGGYNLTDFEKNIAIKDPKQRSNYNNELIKQRLKRFGISGYLKFLLSKQINNTADGTFGWAQERQVTNDYLAGPFTTHLNLLQKLQRKIYMNFDNQKQQFVANETWNGKAVLIQLIWVICLVSLFWLIRIEDEQVQLLKLIFLGFSAFLLFFEGGRSRYLIQFLPVIFALVGVALAILEDKYKKIVVKEK